MAQQGQVETFDYVPPVIGTPQGTTGSDTPLVVGAHTAGDTTIDTDAWTINTLVMKAGDILRFAGHAKTYMVTADATSDGAGAVTLSIRPALAEALVNNEGITVRDVPIQCTFAKDDLVTSVSPGDVWGFSIELVETL